MFAFKALCGIFVIAGTYILSKELFEHSFKMQVNFQFKDLPLFLQLIIFIFGDKRKFETGQIWMSDPCPSSINFPLHKKMQLIMPFIGFILICLGTLGAIFF